jgi:nucleoside phosphorylase
MIPADALLLNNAQSLPDWHLEPEVTRPRVSRRQPLVHFEVIASGEKAIANAEIRDDIAAQDRKLRAVEMEAYGFSRAAFSSFERPRYLVIRSICDMADCNKKDTWHPYAASVVASYVRHFILDGPLESIRKGSN